MNLHNFYWMCHINYFFHCVSTYCQYGSAQSAGQLPLENLVSRMFGEPTQFLLDVSY